MLIFGFSVLLGLFFMQFFTRRRVKSYLKDKHRKLYEEFVSGGVLGVPAKTQMKFLGFIAKEKYLLIHDERLRDLCKRYRGVGISYLVVFTFVFLLFLFRATYE